ncbi:MAG: PLP-dependent aminotransferase family protein [Bryobacterales bacterium]|nr:PLP-dependent aminotransferase family protein [Bryobacterales bacterium]
MLPAIQLDSNSEMPLYRQLSQQLKAHIQSGRLAHGERLPATRELAGSLGLNRATVAAAYEILEGEGLLKGHVGRGSFVNGSAVAVNEPLSAAPAGPTLAMPPTGISFASSRPAAALFPMEEFRETCQQVLGSAELPNILQLGSPAGYPALRRYLLEEARGRRDAAAADDILITSGCQQALDLLQRVLVGPGDTVLMEDPVYPGLRAVFASAGARVSGVRMGADGIDLGGLEGALRRERPKLLVVTPNFQNPTGASLPMEARTRLLEMAATAGVLVVENDIYGSLRYRGQALPSLKALDGRGNVVQLGSFSKIAFPGLRVGWVIADAALIARLTEAKQWCDLHSDQLSQAILYRFAESGRLAAHAERIRGEGLVRLEAALEACAAELPPGSTFTRPDGGMSLWVRLPEPLDAGELLPRAERAGVNYLPGKYFAVSRTETAGLRLCFAGLPPEEIREGLSRLGDVFHDEFERVRAARRQEPAPALV